MIEKLELRIKALISEMGDNYESFITGSRVTCNPPVLDTDLDMVFLINREHSKSEQILKKHGATRTPFSEDEYDGFDENFSAYRLNYLNVILAHDEKFYERFKVATELAKQFNLLNKADRIALFQAILYQKYDQEEF